MTWINAEFWVQYWESLVFSKKKSIFQELLKSLLAFCSFLYGGLICARNKAYDSQWVSVKKVNVPVISVGNLCLGGTGKTSLVMWCIEKVLSKNKRPVVLTRGYRRNSSEVKVIFGEERAGIDPLFVGDEPYLISQKYENVPVIVGANRTETALMALERFQPDCIFLDDGFQHRQLHRDWDIVSLDSRMMHASGLFPRGVMREKISSLKRADFMAVKKDDREENVEQLMNQCLPYSQDCLSGIFSYFPTEIREHRTGNKFPIDWIKGKRVLACSGIANSESFENLLKKCGGNILISKRFTDHHVYNSEELRQLVDEADKNDCLFVTTEKDQVKIPKDFAVFILGIKIEWQLGGEEIEKAIFKLLN